MQFRRLAVATLGGAMLAGVAVPAAAAEFRPFDQAAFAAAQAQNRPILLDVAAWWCPVCHSQEGTIKNTVASPAYDRLIVFKINYDKQKPVWKAFGVDKQATLIGYHGRREVGRVRFKTNRDEIDGLLAATVRG